MSAAGGHESIDLVGIGMSTVDLLQIVEDFPAGECVTEARESRLQGGGPVPTALVAAARLGASAAIIDRIGDDWRGHLAAREYREAGVDTRHLALQPGRSTTFASIVVRRRDGARQVVFSPGDFTPLAAGELPRDVLRRARLLHLNGRHWPACIDAARVVRQAGGLVSFDGGAGRWRPELRQLLPQVDLHIAARDFAAELAGSGDPCDQLGAIIAAGARLAGVTCGAEGSWFATREGEVFHQSAYPASPLVDTTGCGDVFHGAFLFAWSRGWTPRECAAFASAAAALNATALGGRGRIPELEDVRRLIAAGA